MFSPRHARETSRSTIRLRLSVKANIYFGGFCTLSKYTYQIKIFTTVAHSLFFFLFQFCHDTISHTRDHAAYRTSGGIDLFINIYK